MFKVLAPIVGILIAVGLFFTYVNPQFAVIKNLQAQTEEYNLAIVKAGELQNRINELSGRQNEFSLADLERLEAFLPDRIDEVSALIDIDALASSHGLALTDIEVTSEPPEENQEAVYDPYQTSPELVDPNANLYRTLDIGFTVSGTYQSFRAFLKDLEQSLVLMEVVDIAFTVTEENSDILTINMKLRLFSLEPPQP